MVQTRAKKALRNIAFNLLNQIITFVLMFVVRTVFIHVLGIEYLGISTLFTDMLQMLSVADLGFTTAMTYSFYKPLAENDNPKIAMLINAYEKIYRFIAGSVLLIGLAMIPFLRKIISTDKTIPLLELYYVLSLSNTVVSYLFVYKTTILTADQNNYIIVRVSIAVKTIKCIAQIVFLLIYRSYAAYLAIQTTFCFIENIIASRKAEKMYPFILDKIKPSKADFKDIFENMKSVFIYKVSSVLLTATDNIIISIILGVAVVGLYSNYFIITNSIIVFFSLIFTSMTASIGNLMVTDSKNRQYEIFEIEQTLCFVMSIVICSCFYSLSDNFIYVWIGKTYLLNRSVIFFISINLYLSCALQPIWSYREAAGIYLRTKWLMLIAAVINILLSFGFGYLFGLSGILAASALARLLTYVWYEPRLLFNSFFNKKAAPYYKRIIINFILVIIIELVIEKVFAVFWCRTYFEIIIKALFALIFSFGIAMIFYFKSKGVTLIIERFKGGK